MDRDAGLNVAQRLAALGPAFADVEAMDRKATARLLAAVALDVAILAGGAAAVHLGGGALTSPLALVLGGTLALVLAGVTGLVAYMPAWDSDDAFRALRERALAPFLAGFGGGGRAEDLGTSFERSLFAPGLRYDLEVLGSVSGRVGDGACTMAQLMIYQAAGEFPGQSERPLRFSGLQITCALPRPIAGFVRVRRDRLDWFHDPTAIGLGRAAHMLVHGIQLGRAPGPLVKLAGAEFERAFEVHASSPDLAYAALDRRLLRALRALGRTAPGDVTVTIQDGSAYLLLAGVDLLTPGGGTFRRGLGRSARAMRRELALVMAIWQVLEALADVGAEAEVGPDATPCPTPFVQ